MDMASHTIAILLVFLADNCHEAIEYVHIWLVVQCTGCQVYEQKSIPWFIKSIEDDLQKVRLKQEAGEGTGKVHSFCMFIANFGGLMAVPTEPPYCLMYPNIYSSEVPFEDISTLRVATRAMYPCLL